MPANIYVFKLNNRNTGKRSEICSKLTINTPERRHWHRSGVFIFNFKHILHLFLVFLLLTLNREMLARIEISLKILTTKINNLVFTYFHRPQSKRNISTSINKKYDKKSTHTRKQWCKTILHLIVPFQRVWG